MVRSGSLRSAHKSYLHKNRYCLVVVSLLHGVSRIFLTDGQIFGVQMNDFMRSIRVATVPKSPLFFCSQQHLSLQYSVGTSTLSKAPLMKKMDQIDKWGKIDWQFIFALKCLHKILLSNQALNPIQSIFG